MEIEKYKISETCFGEIVEIDGVDYLEMPKEEIVSFITEELLKDNNDWLLNIVLKKTLSNLEFEEIEPSHSYCEQCGTTNTSVEYQKID